MRNPLLAAVIGSVLVHYSGCTVFEKSRLEFIGWGGDISQSTPTPVGFSISPQEAKKQLTRRKTGHYIYHDGSNYYVLDGDRFHHSGSIALKEGTIINGRTGYFYDREAESWYPPYGNLNEYFTKIYQKAVPPGVLFVELHEARYLGSPSGYSVLYYSYIWSGARDSFHGTHKLVVFDEKERYLGSYYLHVPLEAGKCRVRRTTLTLVFDEGQQVILDFLHGTPKPATLLMNATMDREK